MSSPSPSYPTALLQAVESEPASAENYAALAEHCEDTGRLQEAVQFYRKAIELDGQNALYHNNLALLETDTDSALFHFQAAVRLNPQNAVGHYNFASALAEAGRPADALSHYRQARGLDPELPDIDESIRSLSSQVVDSAEGDPVPEMKPARGAASAEWRPVFRYLDTLERLFASRPGFETERLKILDKRLDLNDPSQLLVFVVGEGNFGKSSLVNSLLGRPVAEVSFKPKTWRIDLYHAVAEGGDERAEIRRSGMPDLRRFSIEQAKLLCKDQEEQIKDLSKSAARPSAEAAEPDRLSGQIIEVNWYYAGLALPTNIVLVDTPGFEQFRPGLNSPTINSIGGVNGVAFDLDDIYENYYPRATLVLWAFKASKLNDRDTADTFAKLSQRGKRILGAVTYVDTVPEAQRPELLAKTASLFGSVVREFFPVVTGGRSPEVGLGVDALRQRLVAFSPVAEAEKRDEARQFCRVQAQNGTDWMEGMGNTLVRNVTEVSLYCNAVSTKLLNEARSRHQDLQERLRQRLDGRMPGLDHFVERLLIDEISSHPAVGKARAGDDAAKETLRAVYEDRLTQHLGLDEINTESNRQLERIGKAITAEGAQQAAGRRMTQVKLMVGGETQERPIRTTIKPPDVSHIRVTLPRLNVPIPPGGCAIFLLLLLAAGYEAARGIVTALSLLMQ
jgi:tetratricopeptide (TPR) repeat protein